MCNAVLTTSAGGPLGSFKLSDTFYDEVAAFGYPLTAVSYLGVGRYWMLEARATAIDAMIASANRLFKAVVPWEQKVDWIGRFSQIPCAIGMPGTGKTRLVMVEYVGIAQELARRYHADGLLESPDVVPVLITFNRIGIRDDDPVDVDALLAWHALHAYFGYGDRGGGQRYDEFFNSFAAPHANYRNLALLDVMLTIAKAASDKSGRRIQVLVLVVDEVQVLNRPRAAGTVPFGRKPARDCIQVLKNLQASAANKGLVVCCAVAGTQIHGSGSLRVVAYEDGFTSLQVRRMVQALTRVRRRDLE